MDAIHIYLQKHFINGPTSLMREGCWLGMVTQGGQGLGGLLESEVQYDPPVSQVAPVYNPSA